MEDATEFGKVLRELMAKNNLRQGELAKELGVSPSILSNYITGKNIPEMDFLAKCVDLFALKGKELKNLFDKAYLSSIKTSQKIILDTRYFREDRLDTLLQILMVLQLYSDMSCACTQYNLEFEGCIKNIYDALDNDKVKFVRPSQDDK